MIAVVDYGAGNIKSVQNALEHLGAEYRVTQNPKAIRKASKIILPGVGNFGAAMKVLNSKGLSGELIRAIKGGKPYLGICLGLQLLFEESEETKGIKGLGIFKGKVIRFRGKMKIPHMGWNSIKKRKDSGLLEGIDNGSYFYFVHSFYPEPKDKKIILTTTNYGKEFVSGIEHKNISAFQFHPEKSGEIGIKIMKRFCR